MPSLTRVNSLKHQKSVAPHQKILMPHSLCYCIGNYIHYLKPLPYLFSVDKLDSIITEEDVPEIVEALYNVHDKSESLGILLMLPQPTLNKIHTERHDSIGMFYDVLYEFVKHVNVRPTWRIILGSLRNPLINHPRLANHIERNLPPEEGISEN